MKSFPFFKKFWVERAQPQKRHVITFFLSFGF